MILQQVNRGQAMSHRAAADLRSRWLWRAPSCTIATAVSRRSRTRRAGEERAVLGAVAGTPHRTLTRCRRGGAHAVLVSSVSVDGEICEKAFTRFFAPAETRRPSRFRLLHATELPSWGRRVMAPRERGHAKHHTRIRGGCLRTTTAPYRCYDDTRLPRQPQSLGEDASFVTFALCRWR